MAYSINDLGALVRSSDGACIPLDPANLDYQAYLSWVGEGNQAPQASLADKHAAQWLAIKNERDRRTMQNGYFAPSVSKWFHSDLASRTQQLGLLMYGQSMPANLQWKTMDGTFVTMTPAVAQDVVTAAGASDRALFTYSEQLYQQVLAAEDPWSIDVLAGWPKGYGE